MLRYIILVLVILLSIDGIFRDGHLTTVFLSRDIFTPTVIRVALIVIGALATGMLLHSIIWDLNLLPKPEEKKTEYQKEKEAEEEAERLEKERAEVEASKKITTRR